MDIETQSKPPIDASTIRDNYHDVQDRIAAAANRAGRDVKDVKLVVVSKMQPVSMIQAAVDAGALLFGENYAEQAVPKIEALKSTDGIQWHMIGHVQSRKARIICENFDFLHSLDNIKLAGKLNLICMELDRKLPVLIECNLAGEETKTGWRVTTESEFDTLLADLVIIRKYNGLSIQGLMTMPPISENDKLTRKYFQGLVALKERLTGSFPGENWHELSMGTSSDFEVAIEEGATFVRVGQAILGPRNYSKD